VIENADKNIQILFNSNELRLPCVTAVNNATTVLKQNEIITVNGTKGEIYKGGFSIKPNKYQESMINDKKIATKLFVNFKNNTLPENIKLDNADGACILNADSFIVKLGVHPKKLIRDNKQNLLITSISDYLISTCKLFDLKPVIYQISNLTTNDYRNLEGGSEFEHVEENPNMGMRGAFRHIHDSQSFKLELDAIKKARNALAFKNLWIIIPFVRTVEELKALKQIINESGLQRSTNFRVFMSVDIPSNIIMLEKFIEAGIDGIFINSGLLSSLLTGTDKNNYEITAENNKYNDSLRWTLEKIIKTAGVTSTTTLMLDDNLPNIQGLMKDLVSWGLSGLCVDAETIIQAKKTLIQAEKEYINNIDGKN